MANLAIKGHATRGKEVIEILKMLGGMMKGKLMGTETFCAYYIDSDGSIDYKHYSRFNDAIPLTLEEFLKKYPYKVGDKVLYHETESYITSMKWDNIESDIVYIVKCKEDIWETLVSYLQPYKEETMEIPEKLMPKIDFNEYCKDKYILDLGNYEIKEENGKTYSVRKQFEYPKTYEECCKVLNISNNGDIVYGGNWVYGGEYIEKSLALMRNFQKLLICRDAYWKIAGEQMGLGKPWEPDWNNGDEEKFCIEVRNDNELCDMTYLHVHRILAFPTMELFDIFAEYFQELIEQCKELL